MDTNKYESLRRGYDSLMERACLLEKERDIAVRDRNMFDSEMQRVTGLLDVAETERDEARTEATHARNGEQQLSGYLKAQHVRANKMEARALRAEEDAARLRGALEVIHTAARTDEKHQHISLRRWLDARGLYHGDVSGGDGDDVIAMAADSALSAPSPSVEMAARPEIQAELARLRSADETEEVTTT